MLGDDVMFIICSVQIRAARSSGAESAAESKQQCGFFQRWEINIIHTLCCLAGFLPETGAFQAELFARCVFDFAGFFVGTLARSDHG